MTKLFCVSNTEIETENRTPRDGYHNLANLILATPKLVPVVGVVTMWWYCLIRANCTSSEHSIPCSKEVLLRSQWIVMRIIWGADTTRGASVSLPVVVSHLLTTLSLWTVRAVAHVDEDLCSIVTALPSGFVFGTATAAYQVRTNKLHFVVRFAYST